MFFSGINDCAFNFTRFDLLTFQSYVKRWKLYLERLTENLLWSVTQRPPERQTANVEVNLPFRVVQEVINNVTAASRPGRQKPLWRSWNFCFQQHFLMFSSYRHHQSFWITLMNHVFTFHWNLEFMQLQYETTELFSDTKGKSGFVDWSQVFLFSRRQ